MWALRQVDLGSLRRESDLTPEDEQAKIHDAAGGSFHVVRMQSRPFQAQTEE